MDGSDRGFDLLSVYDPEGGEAYIFLNRLADRQQVRQLFRALERLVVASD